MQSAARAIVDRLLTEVGREHGLDLALDEQGACALELEPDVGLVVALPDDLPALVVYAAITPLPDDPQARHAIMRDALQRNLLQPALGGGALGLDPDGGMLVHAVSAPVEGLDARGLGRLLESAYQTTAELRGALGLAPPVAGDPPPPREPDLIIKA